MEKIGDLLTRLGLTDEEYDLLKDIITSSKKHEEEIKESVVRAKENLEEFEKMIGLMNQLIISQQIYEYSKEMAESKT